MAGRARGRDPRPSIPDGCTVWAFGDIHGRQDCLEVLLAAVKADLDRDHVSRGILVFLGDYVDRGNGSRDVIERLCRLQDEGQSEVHFLRGNHEDQLLAFLSDSRVGPAWCDHGGRETLMAYGVSAPVMRTDLSGWAEAADALARALPERHRRFLFEQRMSFELGDYFFAHAGARPGIPLQDQQDADLLWIRNDFVNSNQRFEKIVVHGHTPETEVVSDQRRIGIDTGAYATGVLTALKLSGDRREIVMTQPRSGTIGLSEKISIY